ncbi:GMP reductase [Chytriomyces confervae]|uniref:GMP reductase n=1 Tax=Chytriomyces confervae TaxID=246404 RepID=A0A507ESP7_9FUNG|nr:GMP reductase [Chytriomyces confervae]
MKPTVLQLAFNAPSPSQENPHPVPASIHGSRRSSVAHSLTSKRKSIVISLSQLADPIDVDDEPNSLESISSNPAARKGINALPSLQDSHGADASRRASIVSLSGSIVDFPSSARGSVVLRTSRSNLSKRSSIATSNRRGVMNELADYQEAADELSITSNRAPIATTSTSRNKSLINKRRSSLAVKEAALPSKLKISTTAPQESNVSRHESAANNTIPKDEPNEHSYGVDRMSQDDDPPYEDASLKPQTRVLPKLRYRSRSNQSGDTINYSDMESMEQEFASRESQHQQILQRAKLSAAAALQKRQTAVAAATVTDALPAERNNRLHRMKQKLPSHRRGINGPSAATAFLDFSNMDTLQPVLETSIMNTLQTKISNREATLKTKWEDALMSHEVGRRRASVSQRQALSEGPDAGYHREIVNPDSVMKDNTVRSWKLNGQLMEEKIMSLKRNPLAAIDVIGRTRLKRSDSVVPVVVTGVGEDGAVEDAAVRRRSSTVPVNINLISQFVNLDALKKEEVSLFDLTKARVGKCPFFSDADLTGASPVSLWGALKEFQFPTEKLNKKLQMIHSMFPSSVSTYNDLRKYLQWSPAPLSQMRNLQQQRNLIPSSILPTAATLDTAVPPIIFSLNLDRQHQIMRLQSPTTQTEAALAWQPQSILKLPARNIAIDAIKRNEISLRKESACICAQMCQVKNDNAEPFEHAAKEEYRLAKWIREKNKHLKGVRCVESVPGPSLDIGVAHWLVRRKHLSFHQDQFGVVVRRAGGSTVVGGRDTVTVGGRGLTKEQELDCETKNKMPRLDLEPKLDYKDVLIRPKRSTLRSRAQVDLTRTFTFRNSQRTWTGVPIVAANMDTVGTFEMAVALGSQQLVTCIHKHYTFQDWENFASKHSEILPSVAVSAGTSQTDLGLATRVLHAFPAIQFVCLDVANGYSEHFVEAVKAVRKAHPTHVVIAGNVVTGEMTEELILAGADIIKVGIGPGSVCTTRRQTGVGYPQLSAVLDCADAAHGLNGHVIADGGCVCPGDVAKGFGAGADFVMLGGMLAGHDESGGETIEENGKLFKQFYGMSSSTAMTKHVGGVAEYRASEGKTVKVPFRGAVSGTVKEIMGGIRSTCTYVGASRLKELSKRTTFIRVTQQINEVFGAAKNEQEETASAKKVKIAE